MKKTKLSLILLLVGLVIAPQITFAAWWNPLSWPVWSIFRKSDAPVVVQVEPNYPEIPETSTSTATTTQEVKVVPKKPQATVPKSFVSTQTSQPKTEIASAPVQTISQEERDLMVNDLVKKLRFIDASMKSTSNNIASLQSARQSYTSDRYASDYSYVIEEIDGALAFEQGQKAIDALIFDEISKIDPDTVENSYAPMAEWFNSWFAIQKQYLSDSGNLAKLILNTTENTRGLIKAKIELETIQEVMAENGINPSTNYGTIEESNQKIADINKKADDYIKSIADEMEKLKGSNKEQREKYLKAIIYSPIGNKNWLLPH